MTQLPDCEADLLDLIQLTEVQKAEMIRRLATEGVDSLDEYIEQLMKEDRSVAERFRRMREGLERDAEKLVSRIEHEHDDEFRRLEEDIREQERALNTSRPGDMDLLEKSDLYERYLEDSLAGAIEGSELFDIVMKQDRVRPAGKLPWYKRFWGILKRFFRKIRVKLSRAWYWLMYRLGRRERSLRELEEDVAARKKIDLYLPFSGIRSIYDKFENKFGNALMQDDKVRSVVDRKLMDRRLIRADELTLKREMDPDGYAKLARQMLREDMRRKLDRSHRDVEKARKRSKRFRKQEAKLRERQKRLKEKLDRRRSREMDHVEDLLKKRPKEIIREKIRGQLEDAGYLRKDEKRGWVITSNLIERFSSIVFSEEVKRISQSGKLRYGSSSESRGDLDKARMRSLEEENRMDLIESIIHARIYHPGYREVEDDDIIVKREINSSAVHVVIAFDKSGSMDENHRLDAAKRATLALYKAVKRHNKANIVDIVAFDSRVHDLSLMGVWNCQPKGFTNTGEAVRVATDLFSASQADRKLFYLVTDGLAEAYTVDGEVFAGDNEKAMEYALEQMGKLHRAGNIRTILIMLEPEDEVYLNGARKLAKKAHGKIMSADPNQLASKMLMDYMGPEASGEMDGSAGSA